MVSVKITPFPLLIFTFLILINSSLKAQESDSIQKSKSYALSLFFQHGNILTTNPYLKSPPGVKLRSEALSLQFLKQTTGKKLWEQIYNYPLMGIGINLANYPDNRELGMPVALYCVYKAPFVRFNKFTINYEVGMGLQLNKKIMNPVLHNYNPTLSSRLSLFEDLGVNMGYDLNNKLTINLGYGVTHSSNGRLK